MRSRRKQKNRQGIVAVTITRNPFEGSRSWRLGFIGAFAIGAVVRIPKSEVTVLKPRALPTVPDGAISIHALPVLELLKGKKGFVGFIARRVKKKLRFGGRVVVGSCHDMRDV